MSDILITGVSGNLGRATAKEFIEKGYGIIGIDHKLSDDPFFKSEGFHEYISLDLLNEEKTMDIVSDIHNQHKLKAGVLIAGGFGMGNFESTDSSDVQKQIDLNFRTAYNTARALFHRFKESEGGKIIMVTAKPAVEQGGSFATAYSISKHMIIKLTEIINEEGREHGISATAIAPEVIDTPVNRESMPDADYSAWLTPEEIGQNIVHLCTEGAVISESVIRLYNKQ